MANINGNGAGVEDRLIGTRGDDKIHGQSGDDFINAARGDDLIIGGSGSDVMVGGVGADTFQWSAGHVTDGASDYVLDFSLSAGDKLSFLDSASGDLLVTSVRTEQRSETEFNGHTLKNGNAVDMVFEIMNTSTGKMQEIVLLDAWSQSQNDDWVDYLASIGLAFDSEEEEPVEPCDEIVLDIHGAELTEIDGPIIGCEDLNVF